MPGNANSGNANCGTQILWVQAGGDGTAAYAGYGDIVDACNYVATQSFTPECLPCAYLWQPDPRCARQTNCTVDSSFARHLAATWASSEDHTLISRAVDADPSRLCLCPPIPNASLVNESLPQEATVTSSSMAAGDGRAPFFVHFHKSAGTEFCEAAKAALPNGTFGKENCNTDELFGSSWPRPSENGSSWPRPSCASMRSQAKARDYSLLAAEPGEADGLMEPQWNPEEEMCLGDFVYGTILRHPLARLQAHMCQHTLSLEDVHRALKGLPSNAHCLSDSPVMCSATAFDNFYIRALLGKLGTSLPVGGVTTVHLQRAAAVLNRFEAVMVMELDLDSAAQRVQLLALAPGFAQDMHLNESSRSFSGDDNYTNPCTQQPSRVKVPLQALPRLGSCASLRRTWRLRAALHSQGEATH